MSLRDLAAASGVSVPTVRQILAGKGNPRASALRGQAAALRVRVGWLEADTHPIRFIKLVVGGLGRIVTKTS